MNKKDTNPKDALGIRKVPLSTVPCRVEFELGLAMLEGARKYGRHNYRVAGVRASVYYDAIMRHVKSWWEGEDIDPDSNLPHIVKAMACIAVLRDGQHMNNWIDDRPPCLPNGINIKTLNRQAAEIIEKYPDVKEPFTEVSFRRESITDPARLLPAVTGGLENRPCCGYDSIGSCYDSRDPSEPCKNFVSREGINHD